MLDAFFLDTPKAGQRFCLLHGDAAAARAGVLYVHPFAEEMNKSRRMAALQARVLAAAGLAVLQIDLHGCGDSSGDFADASWQSWCEDLDTARAWWRQRSNKPLMLWGLRAGCLLVSQAAQRWAEGSSQLWWQPPPQGKTLVQQWLRIRQTAEMVAGQKTNTEALRALLAADGALDVAGYRCAQALLEPMGQAELAAPVGPALWLEVSRNEQLSLLPASSKLLQSWQSAPVQSGVVHGPAFWQATEIEEAPDLIARSTAGLLAMVH